MRWILLLGVLAACHGADPVLAGAPKPSTAAVAGAAAAIAGAATLAAPDAAAKIAAEANKPTDEKKPMKPGPNVPSDVFDRLEDQQKHPGSNAPQSNQPQPQPQPQSQPQPQPQPAPNIRLPGATPHR